MLLLMEKMCRRGEGTKVSRSRVTNFVSKTYSRVALVIDLWDQTGPDWSPPWNGGVTVHGRLSTKLVTFCPVPDHSDEVV